MKLLVLGDFHGEFPSKIKKIIKKEKIDLVVSNGDYFPFHFRKLWFKHCYNTGKMLWEVIGKKKYKKLMEKDLIDGERPISKLNELDVPVITVYGNLDYTRTNDTSDYKNGKDQYWGWDEQDFFHKILRKYKKVYDFTYSYFIFKDFIFIGSYGGTNPGKPKSKAFRKHKKILDRLFHRFRFENKERRVIFVSHNVPNNTKLDKIGMKAHIKVRGKHYGSKLVRRVIDQYSPVLHFGGHIHEGRGIQKVGKTLCLNPGSVHDGEMSIVDIQGKKLKVKLIK